MYQIDIVNNYYTIETLYATTLDVAKAFCEDYADAKGLSLVDPDYPYEWQGVHELYITELDVMDSVDAAQQVAEVMTS